MPTALLVSPHLDDVAFSCGGTALALVRGGWRVVLITVFTASVPDPDGFALACQLDKGLAADVDYLAVRRAEDAVFADRLGIHERHYLGHREAPHRGYGSAVALFAGAHPDDDVVEPLVADLGRLMAIERPSVVLAPQALGNHVDHVQVALAVRAVTPADVAVGWYRDTPYAMRVTDAAAGVAVEVAVPIDAHAKAEAAAAYATQLGFQFGGETAMRDALVAFAEAEGRRLGVGSAAEAFLVAR